jgi:hypothetical protein
MHAKSMRAEQLLHAELTRIPNEGTNMKILMVLTSHDQLGNTGRKTGFWLEEFAAPYFVFRDAGVELTLASPKGGQPPIDPKSDLPENQTPAMTRFKQDARNSSPPVAYAWPMCPPSSQTSRKK